MKEKFKYVTASEEDMRWGLFINVAGCAQILANSNYPLSGHPDNYHFRWSNGRTLDEFQINYITDGSGIMETNEGKIQDISGNHAVPVSRGLAPVQARFQDRLDRAFHWI
jgi:hypothetical protein